MQSHRGDFLLCSTTRNLTRDVSFSVLETTLRPKNSVGYGVSLGRHPLRAPTVNWNLWSKKCYFGSLPRWEYLVVVPISTTGFPTIPDVEFIFVGGGLFSIHVTANVDTRVCTLTITLFSRAGGRTTVN